MCLAAQSQRNKEKLKGSMARDNAAAAAAEEVLACAFLKSDIDTRFLIILVDS